MTTFEGCAKCKWHEAVDCGHGNCTTPLPAWVINNTDRFADLLNSTWLEGSLEYSDFEECACFQPKDADKCTPPLAGEPNRANQPGHVPED